MKLKIILIFIILILIVLFVFGLNDGVEMEEDSTIDWAISINENLNSRDRYKFFPEVWSQHSPYGQSYEFKVNCFGDYQILNECFLWDLDSVKVISPNGTVYFLNKDFNINNYSGEVTRRWVLYGPY